jgi:hypothetical protein
MAEKVIFKSPYVRLQLQLRPERKGFHGEQPFIIPAVIAEFVNGQFEAEDPDMIAAIRATPAFKNKDVWELTADLANLAPPAQKTFRGAVSTSHFDEEAGNLKPKNAGSACETCGKEFPDDLGGKKKKMHQVGHRLAESRARSREAAVSVEEKAG